jgi:hypothetical protein
MTWGGVGEKQKNLISRMGLKKIKNRNEKGK